MNDLIEALQIFASYLDESVFAPTHCVHDILLVNVVDLDVVSDEHVARLEQLGFFKSEEFECWGSFRFGSN